MTKRPIYFLFLGVVFLFKVNGGLANEITREDVQNYFQNPIYEDSWYGVYDLNGIKIGWKYFNEYVDENFFVVENRGYAQYVDVIDDYGTEVIDETILSYEYKTYFDNKFPYKLLLMIFNYQINDDVINYDIEVMEDDTLVIDQKYNGISTQLVKEDFSLSFIDMYKTELLMQNYDTSVGQIIEFKTFDKNFEISIEKDRIIEIGNLFKEGIQIEYYKIETIDSKIGSDFIGIYEKNGKLLEMDLSHEKYIIQNKEVATSDISFGGVSYEDYGVIYTDKIINNPEDLRKIIFLIEGKLPKEILTGHKQELIKENGLHYLRLGYDIGEPEIASSDEIEENLSETLNYPINHSDIKKILDLALPDKSIDDWSKVEQLVKFVGNYIEDDYVSNSGSVLDIIKKGKGDCSEHALLFNTLARSAGIPSKEVSGFISTWKNEFGYHAWNEVVINGVWKSIDPTWEYTTTPITHIKFEDSFDPVDANFNLKTIEEYY